MVTALHVATTHTVPVWTVIQAVPEPDASVYFAMALVGAFGRNPCRRVYEA